MLPALMTVRILKSILAGLLLTATSATISSLSIQRSTGSTAWNMQASTPSVGVFDSPNSITLYLTFDDGIIPESEALYEFASTEQVPLTSFLIGKFVFKDDTTLGIWHRLQGNAWVEVGNHSFTHADRHYFKFYQNLGGLLNDFRINQDTLQLKQKMARLPGRNAWRIGQRKKDDLDDSKAAADSLSSLGYILYGWDIEWNYAGTDRLLEPADDLLFRIGQLIRYHRTFTPNHIVILCHDPALANAESLVQLQSFIQKARQEKHYRFRFLSDYPESQPFLRSPESQ